MPTLTGPLPAEEKPVLENPFSDKVILETPVPENPQPVPSLAVSQDTSAPAADVVVIERSEYQIPLKLDEKTSSEKAELSKIEEEMKPEVKAELEPIAKVEAQKAEATLLPPPSSAQ